MDAAAEALAFDCPRCATAVTERFYGPCRSCRDDLATLGGPSGAAVQTERFEPKMNVVPNHVATKD